MSRRAKPRREMGLTDGFPADFASTDADDLATYGRDWTKVYAPAPSLLVRPRTTGEVSEFLKRCHATRTAVVPSGGRTGLAGGAVAKDREVVLSLERMRAMSSVDTLALTLRVEAGAVTEAVHQHAAKSGLTWPVDFASKGSSQVGGNIATNAGGVRVIRYGLTRQWVLGLEVVLATGEVLELNGALEKNNTGVDLRQLFIGSEGILGVITQATLKLCRLPEKTDVFLFSVPTLQHVLELFEAARQGPFTVSAFEFFTDRCLARLMRHRKVKAPFDAGSPFYVLLEVEAASAPLEPWLQALFETARVTDGTQAQNAEQARALWAYREGISESLSATGLPHKNDIALPVSGLKTFCAELETLLAGRYPGWELCLFGHIGDGNLHVNIMKPDALDQAAFLQATHAVDADLMALVRAHRGSVSAEHGIGLLKREWLGYTRSPAEIALMRQLKVIFDPHGILNPGKVL
ncbi:MAG: FAD-binding oxidoreductase [Archangiaceae bacterium]|nr:FAD-binding oxidoreductase [Archangiaceae bacterium]